MRRGRMRRAHRAGHNMINLVHSRICIKMRENCTELPACHLRLRTREDKKQQSPDDFNALVALRIRDLLSINISRFDSVSLRLISCLICNIAS